MGNEISADDTPVPPHLLPPVQEPDLRRLSDEDRRNICAVMSAGRHVSGSRARSGCKCTVPQTARPVAPRRAPAHRPAAGPAAGRERVVRAAGPTSAEAGSKRAARERARIPQTSGGGRAEPEPGAGAPAQELPESPAQAESSAAPGSPPPPASMMPSFLSDGRPLSAVSSVVNKFGLFDSKAEPEEAARRPVSAPKAQPAPRDPGTAEPPVSAPRTAPSTLCPVCASTELRLHDPGAANYGRCTQCQLLVCSQCGFNPNPHISQVKEWLCLNCQMQRALGMDITSAPASKPQHVPSKQGTPVSAPQVAKQGPAQPTAQKDPTQRPEQAKPLSQPGARKQPLLTKQKSIAASPPQKPKQQSHEQQPPQQVVQKPKPVKQSLQEVSTAQAPETQQASPGAQQRGSKQTRTVDQTTAHQPAGKQKDSDPKIQPQQLKTKGGSAPEPEVVQKEHIVEASQAQKPAQVAKAPQEKQTVGAAPEPLKQPPLKTESKPTQPKEDQGKPSQRPPAAKPVSSQAPPETQRTQKPPEQSRRFSLNLGGSVQPPPFQPTTPQESVTGRLFGFGASLFSQASTLISAAPPPPEQHKPGPKQQPAPPAPAASSTAQKSLKPDTGKREIKPQAAEKSEQKATVTAQGAKETGPAKKDATVKQTTEVSAKGLKAMEPKMGTPYESTCPLCKTVLNIGSSTAPNYNTCTECKAIVCNLCGFNPMPHLTEVEEWLCLTCQTQRALSGQLGDPGKMPPLLPMPSKAPVKQSSPGPPPSKHPPSQKIPPPVSSSPSKSITEQAVVPRSKEMEQEKAKAAQVAKTKEAASTAPAKPAEMSLTVKRDAALREELQAPKPGAAQQTPSAEEKRLQSIPEQKAAAEKQQAGAPEPEHAKTAAGKEAAEVKDMKAEEALSVTGPVEPRSDTTKEQTEQMRKPEHVEKVKVTAEKEEDKSDSSAVLQQRSPQGLSDTGYSSDGISSSLGETTTTLPSEDKDLLKEPVKKDSVSQESCPSSPSDLAKLESTVLSILEAQTNTQNNEKPGQYKDPYGLYTDQERERHRPRTLPITPESYSSDEEDLEDIQEEDEDALEDENHGETLRTTETKELGGSQDDAAVRRQRYDSLEDSSESEHSPRPHRQRTISIGSSSSDSHGSGDEEEFIRKQIIEMSAEEDESGSDEDEFIRGQLKEISTKEHPESKGTAVKHRRLSKKSSTSHDDDPGRRHSWHDDDDDEIFAESPDAKCRETKSQDNDELSVSAGGGLRRFKTIDLNSSMANRYTEDSENKRDALYYDEEPELEMESLTDSPEDRSRGEGSSSLHATSSFTPGTSPTSVSSLDEDSDSSPSHKKVLGESKQQRKARHRTHGPLLPTIEDSSEEEELREEEELLREQERQRELEQQQRKSSSKKSKKDKDELRAQRRREHPKTPPSNLSPIEDASPTEELRQAAEMEELHRSSCSEYSPSNESESEGFEISPEKILEVQKVYKLPTSVLLYSPTDDKSSNVMGDALSPKSLRTAEEAYEEMMQKAKLLQNQKGPDEAFEKEPLYGGMLIEDYIYESLVEDTYNGTADNRFLNIGQETGTGLFQEAEKKLRSPDEIYEEIMRKSPTYSDTKQYGYTQPSDTSFQKQQLASTVQASGQANFTLSSGAFEPSTNFDKQLLDADSAYEELMKRQRALLTPGTSPTQPSSPESPESVVTHGSVVTLPPGSTRLHDGRAVSMPRPDSEASQTAMAAGVMHSIPDVKITQHFTTEEDIEPEYAEQYSVKGHGTPETVKHGKSEATTSPMAPTSTPSCTIPSTAPTTGTPPVCYTLAKDSVAAGKSTSVAPTSTVKVTSLETQKIVEKRKTETVYFYQSLAQGVISTVARELSTEVAQVPVVYNTVPSTGALSVSISIPPDSKYSEQAHLQESKRILDHAGPFLTDVIDLRTLSSLDSAMTGNGMDLSMVPVDGRRQDVMVDAGSVRQGSVVQPTIVNLSTTGPVEQMPLSMQAVPAASVAVVSCSAGTTDTADLLSGPVDLGHAVSLPLQLTAKFDGAAITHAQGAGTSTAEIPINLTCGTTTLVEGWPVSKSSTIAPTGTTNGWIDVEPAEVAAVDLSTTKPHRMMVALDDLTSGVVTAVVEEEDKPVDLTAGRQNVCCDVVYKFPFGRSCSSLAQEPASALPEDRYGYRDDHYLYDRNGPHGYRGFGSMKPSMSDTNLAEAGVFLYKSKHGFDSMGVADRAVDLTAGKLTAGELMDYSAVCTQPQDHLSKGALSYPETRQAGLPQYSQARIIPTIGSHYGMPSVLRSSGGVVYSSVATPIPSTFAITTQPGSIFSHSLSLHTSGTAPSASGLPQSQSAIGLPLGLESSTFQPVGTEPLQSGSHVTTVATYPGSSSAGIFMPPEADSAAVPRLSPVASPASEENKHLLMEREMLEFEKMKQLRLAEELERERHEIQIFREQEKLIVQRELQELQTMKQQLLYQQEEERQAQFMMQQETIAQQQMQLEQIQQLQQQLQQHLEEQKFRQIYHYSYDPSSVVPPQTSADQAVRESQYTTADNGQFWHAQDPSTSVSAMMGNEVPQTESWYAVQSDGLPQHVPRPCLPGSVSEMSLKDVDVREGRPLKKRSSMPRLRAQCAEHLDEGMEESSLYRKIVDSGVQTDDEEGTERPYSSRRRRSKKSVDSSVQTDDEDNQEDWDIPTRRRKSRVTRYADGGQELDKAKHLHFAKLSNIAVQTVAEISVQTEPVGIIRTPSVRARIESKIEIVKHISAPEKTYKGESLGCQTEADSDEQSPPYLSSKSLTTASPQKSDKKRPTPLEIGYSTHLRADSTFQVVPTPPKSPKVLYSPVSPMSPNKEMDTLFEPYEKSSSVDIISQKLAAPELPKSQPLSPRTIKVMQRSMSDPKPLSPTAEETSRLQFQYSDNYMTKSSQNISTVGTQKKVKRTLPNPPPEEAGAPGSQVTFSSAGSVSRRRVCRTNTMARAKILQDIDRELELVERESSKLRKKQAELDEEEKEIDAKLRYLEMGINRRKEALLKEREKRERAYLQGVAEERDYMSDSEVSNIRDTRLDGQRGLERPRTAPQSDYDQFLSSQTQSQTQYATTPSRYTQYQYSTPATTQAQTQYQQQALYHQPVSPYQTQPTYQAVPTITYQQQQSPAPQSQSTAYPHSSQAMLIQQKPRQSTLADLEPKITTHYEVIHNQPILLASTSTDTTYAVPHLSSLDHRLGLDERGAMASSPMSNISADSYYTDLDPHASRNYVLLDDIGELTKGSSSLTAGFNLHHLQKEIQKSERLLHASEARRAGDVKDFIGTLQASSRLHSYGKAEEDSMEDPYELKLLKQQIKQEFRRGTEGLEHLSGLPHYYHGDSSYRHFAKSEKYSISRLTLEKQAAKQLPPSFIYQKQSKHKKQLLDPKISKFLPIQEARDVEAEYASYMGSMPSAAGVGSRARLLQDDITFGLRKNIRDQQKFLGAAIRSTLDDDIDKAYTSGTRSRPSSVYGLDLSIKRDSSSTSLRIKSQESDPLDMAYVHSTPTGRTKPSSLPISHSRGRIPIVAQNSEEESPLSPVGQPMGMARAAAGPLPPISADTREQFGSSHSLPEVQQHMREESRTRGYDRDIAFIMDDFQHAMSDSEAYHLRREETDWFDKPRESRLEDVPAVNRKVPEKLSHSRQSQPQTTEVSGKPVLFNFPHSRVKVQRDVKDQTISGNGLGIKIIGGKEIPGRNGEIGAYIAKVTPGGAAEQTGKLTEGMQVLEWNGIPLTGKTYEEVQCVIGVPVREAEICVRLDLNMLSDSEKFQHLDLKDRTKAGEKQRSPGVDPKQLAAELQKVSQQAPCVVSSASEKGVHSHSGTTSAASSAAPSPGQPASPSVSKKRHSSKPPETASKSHPITGEIQLQMNYDKQVGNLIVHVLQARDLAPRDNNGYSDPFVKVYLLPGRGVENKRRTKHVQKSLNPEWNQTVIYKNISMEQLKKKTLEVTVWDYDRISSNDFLGEVLIDLSNASHFDNTLRWYPLKEQTESIDQVRPHSGQSSQQQPKSSVIKSRSHGIFPDPSKEMHVPTIEKSQSSPASSKSSSEGHLRSHGPSRSQSKSSVTQTHLEDAGAAIAAAEAAVQQLRVQPTKSTNHRPTESSISTASSVSSTGSGYNVDSEGSTTGGEGSVFTDTQVSKVSQDTEIIVKDEKHKASDQFSQQGRGPAETNGKTQVMGEIKIALKKEMKTDGEQLLVEILQCRNITYKFKSPDHLPDLYVKLYVINISTQKRVFKKKTRVCRHDREPSFNETFRFSLSPAGHSLQILLVSNGGKFMRKTLIGEAYIWLDKVDLRKRVVNWHKLLVSSTESQRGTTSGFNVQN
ncbi:protein piccolo [Hypanus sabinus]|uniref:protein piccolo n=1 Tax=Hypanus sabinus TaxID=79690 RepID=UPI0028C37B1E|nr:protein piccolo [Hypanus sabinus]